MATVVAIYDGRTVQEFELLMLTTDPAVVARVMAVLTEGGEVYARPVRKKATQRLHVVTPNDDEGQA